MAVRNFNYDHPAYLVPVMTTALVEATTVIKAGRFAAFTTMIAKSAQVTVVIAGTGTGAVGTGVHTLTFQKIAAAGTAITTFAAIALSTEAAGYTTNVLLTGTLSRGDAFSVLKGAEATGVSSVGIEWLVNPGADFTV